MLKPPCVEALTQKRHTYEKRIAFPQLPLLLVQQHPAPFNFNKFNPIQTWLRLSFLNFIPIGVVTLGCNLVYQSHTRASATDSRHSHSTLCGFAVPYMLHFWDMGTAVQRVTSAGMRSTLVNFCGNKDNVRRLDLCIFLYFKIAS